MKNIYFLSLNMVNVVPYVYGLLRAYAEQNKLIADNYVWKEPFWKMEPVDTIVKKIIDPDILCISCYIWNHNQQLKIAEKVRKRYPYCKVICGGPHVPDASESYFSKHPYVDVLVHGEGEIPLLDLLIEFFKKNPRLKKISGISFNENGRSVKNPPGNMLPEELSIPSPYLLGLFDDFLNEEDLHKIGFLETTRGCPFSCSYCDWGVNSMNKIRRHDLEKIYQEIQFIGKRRIKDLYISDPNFGILDRDLEISHMLVETKKKYGYPQAVRINCAKNTNDRVYRISQLLFDNEMLWSTTLSMQSLDEKVLKAIKRNNIGIDNYRTLKGRYNEHGIPTYTEMILGLPLETRASFIKGVCSLLELGNHDDIRFFQLALLPNAPMSQKPTREKYGLKTKIKPLRVVDENCEREDVELVFETDTMNYDDWAYCTLFAEMIQALHNGGYTRFLSIYLNDNHLLSYTDFYDNLLKFMLKTEAECFKSFKRIRELINDFYNDPDMPETHKILNQPDIMEFLHTHNPARKGWRLYVYLWLSVSEEIESFYEHLQIYLRGQGVSLDKKIRDLLKYQQDIMITLDYDPKMGKTVSYEFNWFGHFFKKKKLTGTANTLHYADTHMGPGHRYELVKNDRCKFLVATNGYAYPYSRFRLFFHQPDTTKKLQHTELLVSAAN
jgi:putative methyltransferase